MGERVLYFDVDKNDFFGCLLMETIQILLNDVSISDALNKSCKQFEKSYMIVGLVWVKPREIPDADDDDWRSLFRGITLSAHDSVVVASGWLQSTELLCSLLLAIG